MKIAIIGTRDPDDKQTDAVVQLIKYLSILPNVTIATGGAIGIDSIAMNNAKQLEVYLPWGGYNRGTIPAHAKSIVYNPAVHGEWTASISLHPAQNRLSAGARSLHARNFGIVKDCDLVLAFPNTSGEGGTAQGIRIANKLGIHVMQFNKGSDIDMGKLLLDIRTVLQPKIDEEITR